MRSKSLYLSYSLLLTLLFLPSFGQANPLLFPTSGDRTEVVVNNRSNQTELYLVQESGNIGRWEPSILQVEPLSHTLSMFHLFGVPNNSCVATRCSFVRFRICRSNQVDCEQYCEIQIRNNTLGYRYARLINSKAMNCHVYSNDTNDEYQVIVNIKALETVTETPRNNIQSRFQSSRNNN